MQARNYKFMCDFCGYAQNAHGFCAQCHQPLTIYARGATLPHPVRYIH